MRPGTLQLGESPPLSLSVHLPWCLAKCPYCDFNSHALPRPDQGGLPEARYIEALIADLAKKLAKGLAGLDAAKLELAEDAPMPAEAEDEIG